MEDVIIIGAQKFFSMNICILCGEEANKTDTKVLLLIENSTKRKYCVIHDVPTPNCDAMGTKLIRIQYRCFNSILS